jgi:hypothetical protein
MGSVCGRLLAPGVELVVVCYSLSHSKVVCGTAIQDVVTNTKNLSPKN